MLVQQLWKSVWQFLRKLGIVLPECPVIPLLDICPKYSLTYNKDTCCTMLIVALFIIARSWEKTDFPHQRNGYSKCGGTLTQWSTIQLLKTVTS